MATKKKTDDRTPAEEETALEALAKLQASELRRALVVDDGHLGGILSISDVAHAIEIRPPIRRG